MPKLQQKKPQVKAISSLLFCWPTSRVSDKFPGDADAIDLGTTL